jgi:hypothetical protein
MRRSAHPLGSTPPSKSSTAFHHGAAVCVAVAVNVCGEPVSPVVAAVTVDALPGIAGGIDPGGASLCVGSPLVLSLTNVAGAAPLSKAQKVFNRLIERIGQQRQVLSAWQEFLPKFQQRAAGELDPLLARCDRAQLALARVGELLAHHEPEGGHGHAAQARGPAVVGVGHRHHRIGKDTGPLGRGLRRGDGRLRVGHVHRRQVRGRGLHRWRAQRRRAPS